MVLERSEPVNKTGALERMCGARPHSCRRLVAGAPQFPKKGSRRRRRRAARAADDNKFAWWRCAAVPAAICSPDLPPAPQRRMHAFRSGSKNAPSACRVGRCDRARSRWVTCDGWNNRLYCELGGIVDARVVATLQESSMSRVVPLTGSSSTALPRSEMSTTSESGRAAWVTAYRRVREETERRAAPLSAEDQTVQSMPDASPTKWHRAHTTWFFEQFLLLPHARAYRVFDEAFAFLFNSYYVSAGPRHTRAARGLLTRPSVAEVAAYRRHVDAAVEDLVAGASAKEIAAILPILEIGLHHEQQHQELMLTDILHALAQN